MRMAPPSNRRAIFSFRAWTASAADDASADKSKGPPVVAKKPLGLGSTSIGIVMVASHWARIVPHAFYPLKSRFGTDERVLLPHPEKKTPRLRHAMAHTAGIASAARSMPP